MTGSQFPPYLRFTDGSYLTLDGSGNWGFFNAAGVEQFTITKATGAIASASVAYASLAASALPKQAVLTGSAFTTVSATFVPVTGMSIVTNGPSPIFVSAQVVISAGETVGALQFLSSVGNLQGICISALDESTVGAVADFGIAFGQQTPNLATAGTYDVLFVGYCTAAATVYINAKSDGTNTITVALGTQIWSDV